MISPRLYGTWMQIIIKSFIVVISIYALITAYQMYSLEKKQNIKAFDKFVEDEVPENTCVQTKALHRGGNQKNIF